MLRMQWSGLILLATMSSSLGAQGIYSASSGFTPGAPDNPIQRSAISIFESQIVEYLPAPGVGPSFSNASSGGIVSLGDLYSPVERPDGIAPTFNRLYQPIVGQEPSPFHAGSGVNDPFGGDLTNPNDTYGFVGIDSPGFITLGFDRPITNGIGADFAVFENGFTYSSPTFSGFFAEFAHVEVSTNGIDFLRFPSISLNTEMVGEIGTFQLFDVTNVYNLAGKHATNWGTPFDLDDLLDAPMVLDETVHLNRIHYVRLVDVIGSGTLFDEKGNVAWGGDVDSLGNPILDNWVTFDSSGFDYLGLNAGAVGVLNSVPEPGSLAMLMLAATGVAFRRRGRRASREPSQQDSRIAHEFVRPFGALMFALAVSVASPAIANIITVDFESFALDSSGYFSGPTENAVEVNGPYGPELSGTFTAGGAAFSNRYSPTFGSWSGFAVSNHTDTTTPGFGNQYSSYVGSGADGSAHYGIAFGYHDLEETLLGGEPFDPNNPLHRSGLPSIYIPEGWEVQSAMVTNTTYAALSMFLGDDFAGEPFDAGDYFSLSVYGVDSNKHLLDVVEFALSDFRSGDPALRFILNRWESLDLSSLSEARSLHFNLASSRTGPFGMNTPGYFAIDNIRFQVVPEPNSLALLGTMAFGMGWRHRRKG